MKNRETILLVDDEWKIVQVLEAYLKNDGYDTLIANDGRTALELFENNEVDLIVLDLMLPDISGEEVCKRIRTMSAVPIVMLTAKAEELDLIQGLQFGADDYIVKPFSPRSIVAKLQAILRRVNRNQDTASSVYSNGDLMIDFENQTVKKQGKEIPVTPTEFKLLMTLTKAPGRVFTRDQLITFGLDDQFDGYDRTIDTHIKSLRNKIEPNRKKPSYILTVYGLGYKFTTEIIEEERRPHVKYNKT